MENEKTNFRIIFIVINTVVLIALFLGASYVGYQYYLSQINLNIAKQELSGAKKMYQAKIALLETALGQKNIENVGLNQTLTSEQNKNNLFESQIQAIGGTVGTLTKLSQTDKELLQKYSKVYFLNENYIPQNLMVINPSYVYNKSKLQQFHTSAYPYLVQMMEAATSTNPLLVISAYRSFGEQASLKANYLVTYGTGANKFSADQGFSEHELGTTVDLTTPKLGAGFTKFDTTTAYAWLNENAYKYGFIISYPKQNTYFQYEPWHWRFVGIELSAKLHSSNQFFYDLPQREIDSYLVSIF